MNNQCEPEPVPVKIVEDQTALGVPDQTIWQWFLKNGIIPAQDPSLPGSFVQGFQQTLDGSNWLKPAFRETFGDTAAPATSGATVTTIKGKRDKVVVIRALLWQVNQQVPDDALVSFEAQSGIGEIPWMRQISGFPADGKIIGSVDSPLTAQFNRLLPISLLPGDILIFKAAQSPSALWDSQLSAWVEEYPFPLRPAGL